MTATDFTKLKRLSAFMHLACWLAMAIVTASTIFGLAAAFNDPASLAAKFENASVQLAWIEPWQIWIVVIVSAISPILVVAALYHQSQVFFAFGEGRYFSAETVMRLRRAGAFFFASAIAATITQTISILALTINNVPGHRQVAIGISSESMFMVLVAGALYATGYVFAIAARIDAENRAFV